MKLDSFERQSGRDDRVQRRTARWRSLFIQSTLVCLLLVACKETESEPSNPIIIGAILPFSGELATQGNNAEQILMMAVEDVNKAGGVNGRQLKLVVRDSNSGSDEGYAQAKELIYDEGVKYLIGPENNRLAKLLIADVKSQNVLHIMPSVTAPSIREIGNSGAWIRLAPTPRDIGCAMALNALKAGHKTVVSIAAADDFQPLMVSAFNTHFGEYGGISRGSFNVQSGLSSYSDYLEIVEDEDADINLMMVYPPTGVALASEWTINGDVGEWYLSPTLYTKIFIKNMPLGALEGFTVFSPSQSPIGECEGNWDFDSETQSEESADSLLQNNTDTGISTDSNTGEDSETESGYAPQGDFTNTEFDPARVHLVNCERANYARFSDAFFGRWKNHAPIPSSLFYYDAVVLLALGLEYAAQQGNPAPEPVALREFIRLIAEPPGAVVNWAQLNAALRAIKSKKDISYSGAAADYRFPPVGNFSYGEARHQIIDTWVIRNGEFELVDTIETNCENFGIGNQ